MSGVVNDVLGDKLSFQSFRFDFDTLGSKHDAAFQLAAIRGICLRAPLAFASKSVRLKNPDTVFVIGCSVSGRWYLGRMIAEGGHRQDGSRFSLKSRRYIGTTSMNAELASIMANLALVQPGFFVYDPFVGTGSVLIGAAAYGGSVAGSDADVRVLPDIVTNFQQYAMPTQFIGSFSARLGAASGGAVVLREIFDAIIADPPYGIREAVYGTTSQTAVHLNMDSGKGPQEPLFDEVEGATKAYRLAKRVSSSGRMHSVLQSLLLFAARTLRLGGRLVFWMATTENYCFEEVPLHAAFRLIYNCDQPLAGPNRRRLLVFVKLHRPDARDEAAVTEETATSEILMAKSLSPFDLAKLVSEHVLTHAQEDDKKLAQSRRQRERHLRLKETKRQESLRYLKATTTSGAALRNLQS